MKWGWLRYTNFLKNHCKIKNENIYNVTKNFCNNEKTKCTTNLSWIFYFQIDVITLNLCYVCCIITLFLLWISCQYTRFLPLRSKHCLVWGTGKVQKNCINFGLNYQPKLKISIALYHIRDNYKVLSWEQKKGKSRSSLSPLSTYLLDYLKIFMLRITCSQLFLKFNNDNYVLMCLKNTEHNNMK